MLDANHPSFSLRQAAIIHRCLLFLDQNNKGKELFWRNFALSWVERWKKQPSRQFCIFCIRANELNSIEKNNREPFSSALCSLPAYRRKNRPIFIVLEIRKLSEKNTTKSNDRVNLIVKYIRMTLNPVRLLCYNAWFFPNHSAFRCFSFLNVHGHWFDEEEKLPCDAMRMQIIIIECAMNYLVNLQNLNLKHAESHY